VQGELQVISSVGGVNVSDVSFSVADRNRAECQSASV